MTLFQMSIASSIPILLIVIIRGFTINRLPKKTFFILWWIVLLRLLLPFSIPIPKPKMPSYALPFVQHLPKTNQAELPEISLPVQPTDIEALDIPIPNIEPVETKAKAIFSPSVWVILWWIGFSCCSLYFLAAYWSSFQKFRFSVPIENELLKEWKLRHKLKRSIQIRQLGSLYAPLTYGVFRPVILMPEKTDWKEEKQIQYILEHEYGHIRHFDAITKMLLNAALCLHWFHPLVWIMYILANRDIELSCDEEVLYFLGETIQSDYAFTLIHMEEKKNHLIPFANHFSKNSIKERIVAIMKYKKKSKVTFLAAFLLTFLLLTSLCLSSVFAAKKEEASLPDINYSLNKPVDKKTSSVPNPLLSSTKNWKDFFSFDFQESANKAAQTVVYESVTMHHVKEGYYPYIHDVRTNHTDKTIITFERGMLAFDKNGNPLKIKWNLFDSSSKPTYDFLYDWDSSYLAPEETDDVIGGWSLEKKDRNPQVNKIAYVLYCDKSITFEDGTVWENPNYQNWLKQYQGKKTDVSVLKNYYPYVQTIN